MSFGSGLRELSLPFHSRRGEVGLIANSSHITGRRRRRHATTTRFPLFLSKKVGGVKMTLLAGGAINGRLFLSFFPQEIVIIV